MHKSYEKYGEMVDNIGWLREEKAQLAAAAKDVREQEQSIRDRLPVVMVPFKIEGEYFTATLRKRRSVRVDTAALTNWAKAHFPEVVEGYTHAHYSDTLTVTKKQPKKLTIGDLLEEATSEIDLDQEAGSVSIVIDGFTVSQ